MILMIQIPMDYNKKRRRVQPQQPSRDFTSDSGYPMTSKKCQNLAKQYLYKLLKGTNYCWLFFFLIVMFFFFSFIFSLAHYFFSLSVMLFFFINKLIIEYHWIQRTYFLYYNQVTFWKGFLFCLFSFSIEFFLSFFLKTNFREEKKNFFQFIKNVSLLFILILKNKNKKLEILTLRIKRKLNGNWLGMFIVQRYI